MDDSFRSKATAENVSTVALFVLAMFALATISVRNCFDSTNLVATTENRMMAPLPKFRLRSPALSSFPNAFNAFYNDRFAYREALISLINFGSYKAFAVSNNSQITVGRHNWLFFVDGGDEETSRHEPLFSQEQLQLWAHVFEARRAWLASKNIKFLFIIAPSKCSIYGEHLPFAFKPIAKESRLDQLLAYLKDNTKVNVMDLRPTLIEAKRFAPIYYHTDTHWNHLGAFLAYSKIANRLSNWFPRIKPLTYGDMRVDTFRYENGDLPNMMGLHGFIPETAYRALPKKGSNFKTCEIDAVGLSEVTHPANVPYATEMDNRKLPRAFCLHDSFMEAMRHLFSRNFSRIAYYKQQEFPAATILREKPDVVIEEIVERELVRFDPSNPVRVDEELAKTVGDIKLAGVDVPKIQ